MDAVAFGKISFEIIDGIFERKLFSYVRCKVENS
jgi:hypothetical protein